MAINNSYDEKEVVQAIATALETFYGTLIEKIDGLNIQKVMKRKNPYLYRAKAMESAAEIVESVLTAFVSSSEETIFGNCFFEPIAIAASGGNKALAEGIDIMIQDNEANVISAIAVKSGPSVFNADSKKRQEQNFMAASKLAQQAKARYEAYIGYCYGKKKESGRGKPKMYRELAGKQFWQEITGDEDFYKKIITYMGTMPEQYVSEYKESYSKAANRLVREFSNSFCKEDGSIAWEQLVAFNSGD
ncbi:PmeII family type II restriction endonuclease [uncultured Clostridium sp.]|uniref:PmeII family type II restriction endonuclease n=1 Tax=uncultured Clostridium sp. TaxID=59620 RepID=UPI0025EF9EDB|nr:PmeII family type II restriction endonuclease [uncultured Clostridium sp.]